MQFHLIRKRDSRPFNQESKEAWLHQWEEQSRLGRQLEAVCHLEGYKEAYQHFEEQINSLVRSKEVLYDKIEAIESVFRYFENGKTMAEAAEAELEKYKDEL